MFHKKVYLPLVLVFGLLTASATTHAKAPELSADRLVNEDDKLIAEGDAHLKARDVEIHSDKVIYNKETAHIMATGGVFATQKSGRIVMHESSYDAQKRTFHAPEFRAGVHPVYMDGVELKGIPGALSAEDTTIYYHEPDMFSLNARTGKIAYIDNETVLIEDATLRIGKIPFFYIPSYEQNIQETPLKLDINIGSKDNLGPFFQSTTFYTQFSEELDPGILLDYYGKRGLLIGPAMNYQVDAPNGFVHGSFRSGFIDDQGSIGELGTDILNRSIDDERHFLEWRHLSRVNDVVEIKATASLWSDSEVERDFREDLYEENQEPDNFAEMDYLGENFIVSFFGRFRPNDFQLVQERLPEVTFTFLPSEVFNTGIYTEIQASASRLIEKDRTGITAEIRSNRYDYYQGLRKVYQLNDWSALSLVAGGRATHYEDSLNTRNTYTRLLGQIGFDLEMTAHKDWDIEDDYWAVHGLRHLVRPRLQYRYIPEAQQGRSDIPQIDREVFSTLLPPIDLSNIRNIDDMHERNVIRVGVENDLQTRGDGFGSRTLASFDIFQDYHFSTRSNENDVASTHSELMLSPAYWINMYVYNRFNPEHMTNQEWRTRLQLTDGDIWTIAVSTLNLERQIDQYQLDASYKLNESYTFYPRLRFDGLRDELTEQVYGIRTTIGHSWLVEYALSILKANSRNDGLTFSIRLELLSY